MELSALHRWQSVGHSLNKYGELDAEIDKLENLVAALEQRERTVSDPFRGGKFNQRLVWTFLTRAIRRFMKGFVVGYGVFSVVNVVRVFFEIYKSYAGKYITRLSGSQIGRKFIQALTDSFAIRAGAFLGSTLCIFESTMRMSRYINGVPAEHLLRKVRYRTILAGSLAGLSLFFLPKHSRIGISTFFFVRALEVACKHACEAGWLPSFVVDFKHHDTVLMTIASMEVCWAALYSRDSMVGSYRVFMDRQSGKHISQRNSYGNICQYGQITNDNLLKLNRYRESKGMLLLSDTAASICPNMPLVDLSCNVLHPETTACTVAGGTFFIQALQRAIKVYIPVYIIPLFLFSFKKLTSKPKLMLTRTIIGILRSTLFLGSYCSIGWTSVCYLRHILGRTKEYDVLFSGACAGSTVLLEHKSRRLELALYVFGQALQSFYNHLNKIGIIKSIPFGEVWLFCISMAIIMHAYINKPKLMRSSYFAAMRFFFGSGGIKEGFPMVTSADSADSAGMNRIKEQHDKYI